MLWIWYDRIQTKQSGCMNHLKQTCNGMQNLKDNYSSSLKSMSKTITPFSIILTMTHMIEFVSSAASVFVTWDVIWILMTSTFFSNLHMVREYIYMSIQTCEMAWFQCWWILNVQAPWGSSMFLLFLWKLAGRSKWRLLSCLIPQLNRIGVILLKLVLPC